jgi:hypothetical protein
MNLRRRFQRSALAIVVVGVLAQRGTARAQSSAEKAALAQGLFESAAQLLTAQKYAEACPKLEESQALDPSIVTQFYLAICYENTGRPTSAWSLFLDVAAAARADGNAVRESTSRARIAALEPRLPRISVVVPAPSVVPGLEIRRDDVVLKQVAWGASVPVDFGVHTIGATAPGKAPWATTVRIDALDQKLEVVLPPLRDAGAKAFAGVTPAPRAGPPPAAVPAPVQERARPGAAQRTAAIVTGSLGVAGIATGSALGIMAVSRWKDAEAKCPTRTFCSTEAHDLSVKTLGLATGSTIAFAVGGAALVGAVVLWRTAPSRKAASSTGLRVLPIAFADGAGALVVGAL